MKSIITLLASAILLNVSTNAQNIFPALGRVGIGTLAPQSSSLFEVKCIDKGVLLPRMTMTQRNAISSPATGLLIYQTDNVPGFYYYQSGWKPVSSSSGANQTLSNLISPTAINASLFPSSHNGFDLGRSDISWKNLYVAGIGYLGTAKLGNYSGAAEQGMIRWTGSDFEGYNGTSWISLTAGKTYVAGSGISISGTTITNSAPDQTVVLNQGTGINVAGTYPNFTISSTVSSTTYTAGTGINITGTTITNSAPTQWLTNGSNIYYSAGNVGVGTSTPMNKFDVKGGLALGTNYAGISTAPTDGLIVEGRVGLGTATPQNKLDVKGGLAIGLNYAGNSVSPTDGLIVEGKVGMGTATPQNKLDIKGGIVIGLNYAGSIISPTDGLLVEGKVGMGTATPVNKLDVKGGLAIGSNYAGSAAAPLDGAIVEGQLGVGTSTPKNKFDVRGGIAIGSNYAGTSVSPADGLIVEGNVGLGTSTPQNKLDVKGGLAIGTGYAGISASPADGMIIQGKVGIGTSIPSQQLEVNGSTKTTNLQITNGAANGYLLQSDASGNASWVSPISFGSGTSSWTVNGPHQYSAVTGNVGIGTTTPQNKLDVKGGIAIGNNYAGVNTAPVDGAIIEGKIGVGTTTPQNKLDVNGGIAIGSNYAGNNASPANGAIVEGKVGIGTATPTNSLDVKGSLAIGNTYAGNVTAAPASSLIVEGKTGLGTIAPTNRLDVSGGVVIGSLYAGIKAAPGNSLLVQELLGIGTDVPKNRLDAKGAIAIGNNYAGVNSAPVDGAIIQGKVGIGTPTPSQQLEVNGTTTTTNFQMTNGAANGYFLQSDASGNASWVSPLSIGSGSSSWTVNGPHQYSAVTGNVGIGTPTPLNKLDVSGGVAIGTHYSGISVSPSDGLIVEGKLGLGTSTPTNKLDVNGGVAIGSTYAGNATPAPANSLIVEGRLGIGTVTPQSKLDVNGGLAIGSHYAGTSTSPTDGAIIEGKLGLGTSTPTNKLDVNGGVAIGSTYAGNATPAPANSLIVEGRAGIGTVTPQNKLDVNGGLAIGSHYAGASTSPTDGAIIEGKLGLGTSTPTNKLDVNGGVAIGSTYAGNVTPAPANSLIVEGKAGIGTVTPQSKLDVNGGVAIGSGYAGTSTSPVDGLIIQGKVGIGTNTPGHLLELGTDDAAKPGTSTWTVVSDKRLKKDIHAFTDGWNVLKNINPVWFTYNGEAGIKSDETMVGTIAQDLQKAAPYMVENWNYSDKNSRKTTEYLAANYHAMFFLLANEAKAQHEKVDSIAAVNSSLQQLVVNMQTENAKQQQSIDLLKSQLLLIMQKLNDLQAAQEACCTKSGASDVKGVNPGISTTVDAALLEQNSPNPFNQNTMIKYYLPKSVTSAKLVLTNIIGTVIKTISLNGPGKGEVNLAAGTLSAGTYFYSLIIDGRIFDSKKMMIIK